MTNLAAVLNAYMATSKKKARVIAAELGLAESAISRIRSGKMMPDGAGMARIMGWLCQQEAPNGSPEV